MSAAPQSAVPGASESTDNAPSLGDVVDVPQPRRVCQQPRQLFALLTALFTATFVDRGVIASNAVNGSGGLDPEESSGLRGDIEMSNVENGLLSSALIVGLVAGSPLTSWAAPRLTPLSFIGLGMLSWCAAALGCGFCGSFHALMACRFALGIGQYPIFFLGEMCLSADEAAPEPQAIGWLTFYFLSGPVGLAFGFFLGRTVVEYANWRYAFFIEAGVVLPLALLCFGLKSFDLRRWARHNNQGQEERQGHWSWLNLKELLCHTVFNLAVLGGALHMGFVTILEYWGARATNSLFDENTVDFYQGAFMAVGTISGCLLGGFTLQTIGPSLSSALFLSGASCLATTVIVIIAVMMVSQYTAFMALLLVTFVALFLLQGPLGGAAVWSVPLDLRPLSRDFHQIVQQVIIAAPAPALYGLALDVLDDYHDMKDSHKLALSSSTILLLTSATLFFTSCVIGMLSSDDQGSSAQDNASASLQETTPESVAVFIGEVSSL